MKLKGNIGDVWGIDVSGEHKFVSPMSLHEIQRINGLTGRATAELKGINDSLRQTLEDLGVEPTQDVVKNMKLLQENILKLNKAVNNIAKVLTQRGLL